MSSTSYPSSLWKSGGNLSGRTHNFSVSPFWGVILVFLRIHEKKKKKEFMDSVHDTFPVTFTTMF